ncbi:hypothetical protein Barb7_02370 [Bacteroidales bacterium Barb7]|nr:hypothetical protein Barb7_02370 [Bacteroidales bacterium Barb7]
MLTGFDRTVLRHILRKGKHQRFTAVQYIDFLPLRFRETVGTPKGVNLQFQHTGRQIRFRRTVFV